MLVNKLNILKQKTTQRGVYLNNFKALEWDLKNHFSKKRCSFTNSATYSGQQKPYTKKEFDQLWREFLKNEVEKYLDSPKKDLTDSIVTEKKTGYKRHEILEGDLDDLNYNLSDDFFSESFKKKIADILEGFPNKTQYQKLKVQEELDLLNQDEYEWKRRVKGCHSAKDDILELFSKNYDRFKFSMLRFVFPSDSDLSATQRAYRKYFKYKMIVFVKGFTESLVYNTDLKVLSAIFKLNDEDFDIIIKEYLSIKVIFSDLVKIIMKMANDNLFNNKKTKAQRSVNALSDNSFVVKKTAVFYEFRRVLAFYLMTIVTNYVIEKKMAGFDLEKTNGQIRNFLWQKRLIFERANNTWWTREHSTISDTILRLLEHSGIFSEIINERTTTTIDGKTFDQKKYILPDRMEDLAIQYTKLPRVVIPNKVTDISMEENLRPVLFGENRITKSDSFKHVLNTSQNKRFGINTIYLAILEKCLNTFNNAVGQAICDNSDFIGLPFLTSNKIAELSHEVQDYQGLSNIGIFNHVLLEQFNTKLVGYDIQNLYQPEIKSIFGLTDFESKIESNVFYLKQQYKTECVKRKMAYTCVNLGKLFKDTNVYIEDTFDVRGRLYPKQPIISRTSGRYKHILCEYTPFKLTPEGLKNLLRSYYAVSENLSSQLENFLSQNIFSKKMGMKMLYNFFEENPLNFYELGDNFLYISLLHTEILISKTTGKTRVMLEIDQTASGGCFLALGLRNRKLALQTNVINKEYKSPYVYSMNAFPDFYEKNIENKDPEALKFLSNSRKIHKYAFMCYCYAQTPRGRNQDFVDRWYLEEKRSLTKTTEVCLEEFASKYDDFIESIFPGLTKQLNTLLKLVDLMVKETGEMSLTNLNGEKLRWKRFRHKSLGRSGFDPVTRRNVSYKINTTLVNNNKTIDDIKDHKIKFLSYLIHSIEAAVMHKFIVYMKMPPINYNIDHLHDCALIHPNYVNDFYDIVDQLYKSNELYDSVISCLFEHAKQELSFASGEKIDKLLAEFLAQSDDFLDELGKGCSRHIYRPEC